MTRRNVVNRHGMLRHSPEDRYHLLNAVGIYGYTRQRQLFVQLLRRAGVSLKGARILDLGSGNGHWTRFFAELRGSPDGIVGLEASSTPLKYARSLSPITYQQGDMMDLSSFSDDSLDFVSAFVSFMFLPDLVNVQQVVRQVSRLLSSEGLLFVSEVNEAHRPEKPYSGYPRREMQRAVENCGFELIESRGVFKNFLGLRMLSSYYRVGFASLDLMPLLEKTLPGRSAYYYQLYRKVVA